MKLKYLLLCTTLCITLHTYNVREDFITDNESIEVDFKTKEYQETRAKYIAGAQRALAITSCFSIASGTFMGLYANQELDISLSDALLYYTVNIISPVCVIWTILIELMIIFHEFNKNSPYNTDW